MKKLLSILLILTLLAALCACGGKKEPHVHDFSDFFYGDKENHFYLCACGEKSEVTAHTLEDDVCTLCGGEIYVFEDGYYEVSYYDDDYNPTLTLSYNKEGKLFFAHQMEYTYFENGEIKTSRTIENGKLINESEFVMQEGYSVVRYSTDYHEDGAKTLCEYNDMGYMIKQVYFNKEGKQTYAATTEYTFDEDGNVTEARTYANGKLTTLDRYAIAEDGYSYLHISTSYNADGSTTVTEYNENGEIVSTTP